MNKKLLLAILIIGLLGLMVVAFDFFVDRGEGLSKVLKGGSSFYGYSVATNTTFASTKTKQIKTGQTILGSVVIASSSAATLKLKNAASTTDIASTTIATIVAAADEGTYTFDVAVNRGLIIESSSGFNGDFVITYQ